MRTILLIGLALGLAMLPILGCTSGDDDSDADQADDDADDDAGDDDLGDDDSLIDDDDEPLPDDYLAHWPQSNVEPADYNQTPAAGPLRVKAEQYDLWHEEHHQPYHGGTVGALFSDDARTTLSRYFDWNDSCEWTGLYLGSQSMRFHVTGEPQAKANALRTVQMLSGNLHVTDTPGFIARYWAEQDPLIYPSDSWCDSQERCHRIESGEFAGNWWWGETSRDMYNGWFFGMSLAYDLVDDEQMRETIREDVTHVLTVLMDQDWMILNQIGEPTDSAPNVMANFRLAWLTIGYHITGDRRIKAELQYWLRDDRRTTLRLSSLSFMNRYTQYFGNCLSHEYWYNLLRLGKVYFSPEDYAFLLDLFESQAHTYTRLSHNPWFNGVFMSQGFYRPEDGDDPYLEQLLEDLTDFPEAPNHSYHLAARDPSTYVLDPMSVFLHDLMQAVPMLADIMGNVDVQALEAFPVGRQCATDFLFQRNPFQIEECGVDNPKAVNPGVDYLLPYWLASYHRFADKPL
ncbi:MAG: hypothetical protein P9M14_03920 [Candidatus Alcyoniella australis]|nr:hypothetical protein [Candidatus Alcyoniella australis]